MCAFQKMYLISRQLWDGSGPSRAGIVRTGPSWSTSPQRCGRFVWDGRSAGRLDPSQHVKLDITKDNSMRKPFSTHTSAQTYRE